MKQYRQGDVFLRETKIDLSGARVAEKNILAYGEGSGHAHVLEAPVGSLKTVDARMYVVVEEETNLNHTHLPTGKLADHNTIKIEPGVYEVVIQKEYNPYEKAAKQVID